MNLKTHFKGMIIAILIGLFFSLAFNSCENEPAVININCQSTQLTLSTQFPWDNESHNLGLYLYPDSSCSSTTIIALPEHSSPFKNTLSFSIDKDVYEALFVVEAAVFEPSDTTYILAQLTESLLLPDSTIVSNNHAKCQSAAIKFCGALLNLGDTLYLK